MSERVVLKASEKKQSIMKLVEGDIGSDSGGTDYVWHEKQWVPIYSFYQEIGPLRAENERLRGIIEDQIVAIEKVQGAKRQLGLDKTELESEVQRLKNSVRNLEDDIKLFESWRKLDEKLYKHPLVKLARMLS